VGGSPVSKKYQMTKTLNSKEELEMKRNILFETLGF
jgi:hypothetical protein